MGRKSKLKQQNKKITQEERQDSKLSNLIDTLLQQCSSDKQFSWDEYLSVYNLSEQIKTIQAGSNVIGDQEGNREVHIAAFLEWLQANGMDHSAVSIQSFPGYGYGLKATRHLKKDDQFMAIPKSVMMTNETASKSAIGFLIEEDRMLAAMPNVMLTLHVLHERLNPGSFWLPYLMVLPVTYNTVLYTAPDHLQALQCSPVKNEAILLYRNVMRQYCYLYRLFKSNRMAADLPFSTQFTLADYIWSVSTVMTRQNKIPNDDGSTTLLALIPMWDMCNHKNGIISTDYSPDKRSCICHALEDFNENEQIFIFYGARTNADFLLHNGFVYMENQNDSLPIKLGVSSNDPLYPLKSELLQRAQVKLSGVFHLRNDEMAVDSLLLTFLRIFSMGKSDLKARLTGLPDAELVKYLGDVEHSVSADNEMKTWSFLEARASLLLRQYKTSIQEDEKLLEDADPSQSMFIAQRLCEKRILDKTMKQCATFIAQSRELLDTALANVIAE